MPGAITDFKKGTAVTTSKSTYTVVSTIGNGQFGAVYEVKDTEGKTYAMKVERKLAERRHPLLKMEIAVLKVLGSLANFPWMVDNGKRDEEGYSFIVMQLLGKNLAVLKLECTERRFSFETVVGIAKQSLMAVEWMHEHGWLHRNVKPHNFCIGLEHRRHNIFIVDFGTSRKYLGKDMEIKTPREHVVEFKGTLQFAPLSSHRHIEQGPKDDLESWFYMLLDLLLVEGLPWRNTTGNDAVMKAKERSRTSNCEGLLGNLKNTDELKKIIEYIDSKAYQDTMDCDYIYKLLEVACANYGLMIDAPFDWEKKEDV